MILRSEIYAGGIKRPDMLQQQNIAGNCSVAEAGWGAGLRAQPEQCTTKVAAHVSHQVAWTEIEKAEEVDNVENLKNKIYRACNVHIKFETTWLP